jgi:hypothetical protein
MVPTYMLAVMLTGHMTAAATASGSDKESEMVLCDGGRRGRRLSLAAHHVVLVVETTYKQDRVALAIQ